MSLKKTGTPIFVITLLLPVLLSPAFAGDNKNAPAPTPTAAAVLASPLTPEVKHRVISQIRSRFSIPAKVGIAIADPIVTDMPGYDSLKVTFTGDQGNESHDFLISKDRKTLARFEKFDVSQDFMSRISLTGRPVRGNPNAKVTVVVYDDFQCPYCGRMYNTVFPEIFNQYKDKVRFIFKDYPLQEIHPWAMHAAVDANCLAEQNTDAYWDYSDYIHANQRPISGNSQEEAFNNLDNAAREQASKHHLDLATLQSCFKQHEEAAITASIAEGDKLGVESTPTMFVDDVKYLGALSPEETRKILDAAIADEAAREAHP